jgi:alanyl-tRNA synthetase
MWNGFSVEFCGGTHLDNTAKAGMFRIKSEGSVASGVRRIEATVGKQTMDTISANQQILLHLAQMFKTNVGEVENRIQQQAAEMKELRTALEKFKAEASLGEARQFLMAAKEMNGVKVLTANKPGMDANALRQMGDFLRDKEPAVVAVLASVNGDKITFLAVCGKDAVAKGIKAGDLVKNVCTICGGKGGGKPDSAMGGGSDLLKLDDALASVDDFVASKLG